MIRIGINNSGITLSYGGPESPRLVPDPKVNQAAPRRSYVYAHMDQNGVPFYIGKGTGRRAWSKDRDRLWHRYVEKHLHGQYSVVVLADDLSSEDAEELESVWIAQETETLVNGVNAGRKTDFAALARYHQLKQANRAMVDEARALESTDLPRAVEMYRKALAALPEYVNLLPAEGGLLGQLQREEIEEVGRCGDLVIVRQLTSGLVKLGKTEEALEIVEQYFKDYRGDTQLGGDERLRKRLDREIKQAAKRSRASLE